MPTVHEIADHLADVLDRERYHREGDPAGVWLGSDREVARLGLRLEAGSPPYRWAENLDAVLVHRPFGLWPARWPEGVGVLAAHRALDDRLAVGHSPLLAAALGLAPDEEPLRRDGKVVGLVGRFPEPLPGEEVLRRVRAVLGGEEEVRGEVPAAVGVVALVGAMTVELVGETAQRGGSLYITGQLRKPALAAADAAGLAVVAVGQARSEAWGLRHLGRLIRERWPTLAVLPLDLPAPCS